MMEGISSQTAHTITIQPATPGEFPQVLALLARSGLPEAGLADHLATTLVARGDGRIVGCVALELYGDAALLRSVAVEPALRSQGLGSRLTGQAFDLARQNGVRRLYLLTESAAGYFARRGFQPIARSAVEAAVQQSVEFRFACPQSAQAMRLEVTSQVT
jgi:amino-acid N-acetyltransferase